MSYELIDDFVRHADARPILTDLGINDTKRTWSAERPVPSRKMDKTAKPTHKPEIMKRPAYLCPELGRTCHRPGAYDAYDLPSLYNGELKPYRFKE